MPDYYEAIKQVFHEERRILSRPEVFSLMCTKYPGQEWVRATAYSYLGGLTVNDHSRCYRPSVSHLAFLFNLGRGRRRLYDPERDGLWVCTDDGVQYVNQKAMLAHVDELEPGLRLIGRQGLTEQRVKQDVVSEPDLLAADRNDDYVVIGIARGVATVKTVVRMLRQIKRVKKQLAGGNPVRGIIVAYRFEDDLHYAVPGFLDLKFAQYNNQRGFSYRWDRRSANSSSPT